jgi:hypothetical protein
MLKCQKWQKNPKFQQWRLETSIANTPEYLLSLFTEFQNCIWDFQSWPHQLENDNLYKDNIIH